MPKKAGTKAYFRFSSKKDVGDHFVKRLKVLGKKVFRYFTKVVNGKGVSS